ncbi:DNA repair/RNA processing cpsf family [Anaeramoeba ignava]|uniref:DNA repair/RNA processing cpsf family n=1 Tax=Anaeramoeba ignava TaxID=1746090 RepID=A0A9Q0RDX9_ANAIG|nr:DNA repair/RNA processing cpsf family [Anaeramoeba ignava]
MGSNHFFSLSHHSNYDKNNSDNSILWDLKFIPNLNGSLNSILVAIIHENENQNENNILFFQVNLQNDPKLKLSFQINLQNEKNHDKLSKKIQFPYLIHVSPNLPNFLILFQRNGFATIILIQEHHTEKNNSNNNIENDIDTFETEYSHFQRTIKLFPNDDLISAICFDYLDPNVFFCVNQNGELLKLITQNQNVKQIESFDIQVWSFGIICKSSSLVHLPSQIFVLFGSMCDGCVIKIEENRETAENQIIELAQIKNFSPLINLQYGNQNNFIFSSGLKENGKICFAKKGIPVKYIYQSPKEAQNTIFGIQNVWSFDSGTENQNKLFFISYIDSTKIFRINPNNGEFIEITNEEKTKFETKQPTLFVSKFKDNFIQICSKIILWIKNGVVINKWEIEKNNTDNIILAKSFKRKIVIVASNGFQIFYLKMVEKEQRIQIISQILLKEEVSCISIPQEYFLDRKTRKLFNNLCFLGTYKSSVIVLDLDKKIPDQKEIKLRENFDLNRLSNKQNPHCVPHSIIFALSKNENEESEVKIIIGMRNGFLVIFNIENEINLNSSFFRNEQIIEIDGNYPVNLLSFAAYNQQEISSLMISHDQVWKFTNHKKFIPINFSGLIHASHLSSVENEDWFIFITNSQINIIQLEREEVYEFQDFLISEKIEKMIYLDEIQKVILVSNNIDSKQSNLEIFDALKRKVYTQFELPKKYQVSNICKWSYQNKRITICVAMNKINQIQIRGCLLFFMIKKSKPKKRVEDSEQYSQIFSNQNEEKYTLTKLDESITENGFIQCVCEYSKECSFIFNRKKIENC